jgi:hypothetical protein
MACAAVAYALGVVPGAVAATPAERVYGGQGGNIQGDVAGGGAAGGVLPFTGLDLMMMLIAATLLIGAGLTMRRLARARV